MARQVHAEVPSTEVDDRGFGPPLYQPENEGRLPLGEGLTLDEQLSGVIQGQLLGGLSYVL